MTFPNFFLNQVWSVRREWHKDMTECEIKQMLASFARSAEHIPVAYQADDEEVKVLCINPKAQVFTEVANG